MLDEPRCQLYRAVVVEGDTAGPKRSQDITDSPVQRVDRIVDAKGREEDRKEPMESDPDYESGENTTFPKLEDTLGRTQEVPPSHEGATPPPAVSDVLGSLTRTLLQLSAVTGLSRDVELPRYNGSYEAQSFFTNYDAQADRAQLQYSTRLRKLPNLLQAPLRVTNTRAPFPDVQKARQLASSRTQLKHERDKQRYDKGHQAPHFEIGDLVLVKNYKHSDTGKLTPYFTGPFTIIEIISPNQAQSNFYEVVALLDNKTFPPCLRQKRAATCSDPLSYKRRSRSSVSQSLVSRRSSPSAPDAPIKDHQATNLCWELYVFPRAAAERDRACTGGENGSQQQVDLQRPLRSQKVNQVKFNSKKQSPKQQQQPSRKKKKSAKTRSRCPKCGGFTHREGQACRAEGQRCNLCSKTGHFANFCPDKQAMTAEIKAVSELDEEIGVLLEVSAVEDSSNLDDDEGECRRRWTAEIQVNGKQVKFKLDSQADVTCVPLCLFKKILEKQRLVESDINIRAAEFSELQTVGMFISTLRNGNYEIKEKIYVIRRLSEPLLSRRACELLNLARRIEVVATRINLIKEFPEVFEGLGQIGNPYEIKLKPGAKPYAVHTPRRVPIPLMEKLKTRLEELEKAGIIAQVNVATEWCAPTVIAGKPNGDIRLCVGLSRLNEDVQREVHPMPVVEHMLGQLGEARFFSKLDANKYFQKVMSIILQGMDGVMCYLDDILIFASDSKTYDRILHLVLRKLKEAKVTLNKAKCVFGVPRINFLGHILDEDGIRPDPAKIEAVAKMPAPTDVHGVRFLGMVNHLGRFVENLSEIVAPLNQLLVKSQDFVWDCSQERAFQKLKELLTTQPILAAYDVRKPTMV
ncbi:K02A2.6-like [Cordylochernes scorpioides]|uniref:K02A2.6-like n=1 Tax=Cordylochernes scorpioides TaxID=51811 RepID=A0ABY6KYB4_9ARAC|nr:K02A2.6-like [Cordylochernes scorpioides]